MSSMTIIRSLLLFALAALAEIGGAWLIWQTVREHRTACFAAAGVIALGAYGFVAAFHQEPSFGRVLAAYGGVNVVGSIGWAVVMDKFRPDRYDIAGAATCLLGVAVIMYAPAPERPSAATAGRDRCRASPPMLNDTKNAELVPIGNLTPHTGRPGGRRTASRHFIVLSPRTSRRPRAPRRDRHRRLI